jgi:Na+-driven multidrug efflux pump
MGVFGAALATIISQAVAGLLSLFYIIRNFPILHCSKDEQAFSASHCAELCRMGLPMGLQCSITAIGSVVLQSAVNGLGSDIVAAMTAGSKAGQLLTVPLESIGTAMTTYTGQNLGAKQLDRVHNGVNTALCIGCVYAIASFVVLHFSDTLLIGLFLDSSEQIIIANAQRFLFWNSLFYIPLAVLIVYRYSIQGLGYSSIAMFAGVAEMIARGVVGFMLVKHLGYLAACIANPLAWLFACAFLLPAYVFVMRRLRAGQTATDLAQEAQEFTPRRKQAV